MYDLTHRRRLRRLCSEVNVRGQVLVRSVNWSALVQENVARLQGTAGPDMVLSILSLREGRDSWTGYFLMRLPESS